MGKVKSMVGFAIAFLVGIVPAFFVNLNSVFSDSDGSLNELLSIFLLIVASYVLLGLAFGFFGEKKPWVWGVALSLPSVIILGLYSFHEPESLGQSFVSIGLTLISAWIGSKLGIHFKAKRS